MSFIKGVKDANFGFYLNLHGVAFVSLHVCLAGSVNGFIRHFDGYEIPLKSYAYRDDEDVHNATTAFITVHFNEADIIKVSL